MQKNTFLARMTAQIQIHGHYGKVMKSSDFYLKPLTMSYFFLDALEDAGHGIPQGWRKVGQDVEVLTLDNKILRISVGGVGMTGSNRVAPTRAERKVGEIFIVDISDEFTNSA